MVITVGMSRVNVSICNILSTIQVVFVHYLQAVSGKDAPLNNFFFYDGLEGHGSVECFK